MSVLSQFVGGQRVTSLVGTPSTSASMSSVVSRAAATAALSGAMTSATLKTALTITGRGRVNWLELYTNDATSRTLRMKLTLDGTVIRDHTTSAIAATSTGFVGLGVGVYEGGPFTMLFQPLTFTDSLLVEIASSVTETDKASFAYNYEVFA